jgi:3-oxoacyl-[acyl-carrier protein] reductase
MGTDPNASPTSPYDLGGRVAVVTGAAQGIGLGIASEFIAAGARVLLVDVSEQGLAEAMVPFSADSAAVHVGDISSPDTWSSIIADAVRTWDRLDILINNAGITRPAMLVKMTDEQWDDVLRVNLRGVFLGMRSVAQVMVPQQRGSIINISSMAALRGSIGQVNYSAAKGAIVSLTKSGARELARYGIRVNAIAPGTVRSPMTSKVLTDDRFNEQILNEIPLGRVGEPTDIAYAARFLASDAASWITGQVLSVNGGTYL